MIYYILLSTFLFLSVYLSLICHELGHYYAIKFTVGEHYIKNIHLGIIKGYVRIEPEIYDILDWHILLDNYRLIGWSGFLLGCPIFVLGCCISWLLIGGEFMFSMVILFIEINLISSIYDIKFMGKIRKNKPFYRQLGMGFRYV